MQCSIRAELGRRVAFLDRITARAFCAARQRVHVLRLPEFGWVGIVASLRISGARLGLQPGGRCISAATVILVGSCRGGPVPVSAAGTR